MYFLKAKELIGYIDSLLPEPNGKRLLAVCPHNELHHWTLGLVARSNATAYVHIDAHPDDSVGRREHSDKMTMRWVDCASFVQYIPKYTDAKTVRMIGPEESWCELSKNKTLNRIVRPYHNGLKRIDANSLRDDSHLDVSKIDEFLHGIDDIYVSIDLDVTSNAPSYPSRLHGEELCEAVGYMAGHKNILAADIYPGPNNYWGHLIKPLVKKITSF